MFNKKNCVNCVPETTVKKLNLKQSASLKHGLKLVGPTTSVTVLRGFK